eukprot:4748821-Ditylum_brightwellii.AAC.1
MEEVLSHAFKAGGSWNGTLGRWELDEPDIMFADEVIYYFAQKTYTSTYPLVTGKNFQSTMGESHKWRKDYLFGQSSIMPEID